MTGTVLDTIAAVIRETFEDDSIEIDRDTIAEDVPGWDSLSHTILMVALEDALGIKLPPDTRSFANIGALEDTVSKVLTR